MIPTYDDGLAKMVQYTYDITLPNTIDVSRDKNFVLKHSFHNQKISAPQSGITDVLFSQKLCTVITAFFGYLGERFAANRNCRVTVLFPEEASLVIRFVVEYHASIHLLVMVYAAYRPNFPHVGNLISPGCADQEIIIDPVEENVCHLMDTTDAVTDWKAIHNARTGSVIPFCLGILIITEDYRPTVLCDFDTTVDLIAYTPNNDLSMFTYGGGNHELFGSHPDIVRVLNEYGIKDEQYIYLVSDALYLLTHGLTTLIEMECCDKGILFRVVKNRGTIVNRYRTDIELQTNTETQINYTVSTKDNRKQVTLCYPEGCMFPPQSDVSVIYCDPFDPDNLVTENDYWSLFAEYVSNCLSIANGFCDDEKIITLFKTMVLKSVPHIVRIHLATDGIYFTFYEEWVSTAAMSKPKENTSVEFDNIFSGRSLRDGCIYLSGLAAVDEDVRKLMKKYLKF